MKHGRPRRQTAGFTLVEIMIAVTIVGLLAVIAIPAVRKSQKDSQNVAFLNDLRVISGRVIEFYAIETGKFPLDAAPGVAPPELGEYIPRRFDWARETPIGGHWDWDRAATQGQKVHGCYAGLSVHLPRRTTSEMQDIDRIFDDGNLQTGSFRGRPNGYIYIIQP